MKSLIRTLGSGAAVALLLAGPQAATAATATAPAVTLGTPLGQAHAHNDYEHERPLLDALGHGFTSVEADVWLVDGELLVAHDPWELDDAPTLEEAYLEPLSELVSPNGKQLYPGYNGDFQLLIDIKSEGPATWAAIEDELAEHSQFITRYKNGQVKDRAVEAVISGNRPLADMQAADTRYSAYDGRSTDLVSGMDPEFMPLVSENWTKLFTWQGVGEMPAVERERLHEYVDQAHAAGYRVRFWATNDMAGQARENLWAELEAAGVDHINTDDLAGLQTFLGH
ncbi:phosphatidylinositol-specific phospholipase C/glycerophosphodiester phosphodiesterase family protein [Citricoccus nitrophenolicus]